MLCHLVGLSELQQVTMLDLISANITLCLAQDVKGYYFIAPTFSPGFGIKSSDRVPTERSTWIMAMTVGKWEVGAFQAERV